MPWNKIMGILELLYSCNPKKKKKKKGSLTECQFTPFTMKLDQEDGNFPWSDLMVQLPLVWFLKKEIYKAFGLLTRCTLNADQEK